MNLGEHDSTSNIQEGPYPKPAELATSRLILKRILLYLLGIHLQGKLEEAYVIPKPCVMVRKKILNAVLLIAFPISQVTCSITGKET